jgi:single-strand DNA-binding protein
MNSCILMATIVRAPELRHTSDTQTAVSEMLVEFEGSKPEERARIKVVGWGNLGTEIHETYSEGDVVVIEGRLSMRSIERKEGFKEKRAELVVSRIHRVEGQISSASPSTRTNESRSPVASESFSDGAGSLTTTAKERKTTATKERDNFPDYSDEEATDKRKQPVSTLSQSEDEIPF